MNPNELAPLWIEKSTSSLGWLWVLLGVFVLLSWVWWQHRRAQKEYRKEALVLVEKQARASQGDELLSSLYQILRRTFKTAYGDSVLILSSDDWWDALTQLTRQFAQNEKAILIFQESMYQKMKLDDPSRRLVLSFVRFAIKTHPAKMPRFFQKKQP